MKKLIFSSLVGLALVAFTGCYGPTADKTVETQKCQAGKCQAGKCAGAPDKSKKCGTSSKCGDAKKVVAKCSGGKCGSK